MVKFITKSVCMALIAMLCVGNVNAQSVRKTSGQEMSKSTVSALYLADCAPIQQPAPAKGRDVVYSEGFEGTTGTALPTGWTTAGGTWVTMSNADYWSEPVGHCGDPFDPHGGTRMMGREWYNSGNYWVFSDGFSLAAGEAYEVTFWFSAPGWPAYGEFDNFEVKIGQAANSGGMTDLIYERLNNNTAPYPYDWTKATGTFTPTTAGTYYLGLHDLNPAQTGLWILIDDIEVTESGAVEFCPPVTNLAAELQGADVKLTWTAATGEPTGYKVYDGTTLLGTVTTTEYVAQNLSAGEHTLGVEATYSDGCTPVKVTITVTVLPTLPPVKNLNGNCDDGTLTLTWTEPDPNGGAVSEWVTYGTSDYYGGVGVGGPVDLTWAQRWSPADLATLGITTGSEVTKMKFVFSNFTSAGNPLGIIAADYYLKIWQGASSTSAGTEKLSQQVPFNTLVTGDWNEFTLDTPVEIDASLELWIGIRTNMTEGDGSPAANESGPFVQGVNMLYYSGSWSKIETLIPAMTGNWMVAALVEGEGGESVALSNYDIYQDDVKIDNIDAPATTYTKTDMPDGESTYCVVAVYENDAQSEKVCKTILCGEGECLPPNLTVALSGDDAIKLDWTYPTKRGEVIITQGGDPSGNAVGAGTSSLGVYHRFTPDDLAPVNGGTLTHLTFSPSYSMGQGEPGHTYTIRIYQGGTWGEVGQRNPGTLIYSQDLDNALIDWYSPENTFLLDTPLTIDASQELWLGYYCTNIPSAPVDPDQNGKFPAGTDYGPAKEGFGNITHLGTWRTLMEASNNGINENWVIKGLVQVVIPTVDIYRNGTILQADFEGTTYTDKGLAENTEYCYYLITNCPSGTTSEPSDEKCETTPGVGIAELANSVTIYPNPTTGMITITADNCTFSKVEIYNTVGQLVDTKTVSQFDISSYSTGVYLFKVYDAYNNSVTKRVMVTK